MRNNRTAFSVVLALLLMVPFFASLPAQAGALTADELAAQIKSILSQIAALQQRMQAAQATPGTSVQINACPQLFRSLSVGMSGPDVLELQRFLLSQTLLDAENVTGAFGVYTQGAVQFFQATRGIISSGSPSTTGYGMVGPRTRADIALRCRTSTPSTAICPLAQPPVSICSTGWRANTDSKGCVTSYKCALPLPTSQATSTVGACTAITLLCPSGTYDQVGPNCSHACVAGTTQQPSVLLVTPTAGQVPLLVNFSLSAADSTASSGVYYTIDFGDGQTTGFARTSNPSILHTYASAGTYTATVTRRTGCGAWECLGSSTVISMTTIIAGSTPPFSISSPTSGQSAQQGQGLTIAWDSQNALAGSAVALWLVKSGGANAGLVARNQLPNGTFSWQVPGPKCNSSGVCVEIADSPAAYYTDVGTYWIVGKLYTPVGAYLGGFPPANPVTPSFLATATSSLFNIVK